MNEWIENKMLLILKIKRKNSLILFIFKINNTTQLTFDCKYNWLQISKWMKEKKIVECSN
jgi:hypothetical protein